MNALRFSAPPLPARPGHRSLEVPGARAHAPQREPRGKHHKSQLELYTFARS
jgi:hypothetical protein